MAAMNRKLVACSLVVVFLACSCAALACASRPLAAAAAGVGSPRRVLAAAAGLATVSRSMDPGSRRPPINDRRLLGTRTTWLSPPLPNKMKATAMPAPPPPII